MFLPLLITRVFRDLRPRSFIELSGSCRPLIFFALGLAFLLGILLSRYLTLLVAPTYNSLRYPFLSL